MKPEIIAAIDAGSNSFHMIIAEVFGESLSIIARERQIIRLGTWQQGAEKIISEDEINHAVAIMKRFSALAASFKARIIAVATSAVRDAFNRLEFEDKVFTRSGIKVNIITGKREAELIFAGVKKALNLEGINSLCLDIGGGSTELVYYNGNKIVFAESFKLGAVRLTKKFFPESILSNSSIKNCTEYIAEKFRRDKDIKYDVPFRIAAGSSGTIQNAASIINFGNTNKLMRKLNGHKFSAKDLNEMTDFVISCRTTKERLRIGGIEGKRADILPAGLLILNKVFELFRIKEMVISEYALREGIIFEHAGDIK
jgi:exopolyphosphatase/guanosine-5'-triphosphate,3'-diphosphate pyrophosphatase